MAPEPLECSRDEGAEGEDPGAGEEAPRAGAQGGEGRGKRSLRSSKSLVKVYENILIHHDAKLCRRGRTCQSDIRVWLKNKSRPETLCFRGENMHLILKTAV